MEGFPIGEDEDIINLSDPPYFTACPNPWLNHFILEWEKEKELMENEDLRVKNKIIKEPYAADIIEGKNHTIYKAHSYHTKVPHEAIMRYILHYSIPGDIIYDGFSGTGMTGVAASFCEVPEREIKAKIEKNTPEVKWGKRNCILGDLSPYASFIANGYNSIVDNDQFSLLSNEVIEKVEDEFGELYLTKNSQDVLCKVNYILWSQMRECSSCGFQQPLWTPKNPNTDFKFDTNHECQKCNITGKKNFSSVYETTYDPILKKPWRKIKYIPVLINYYNKGKKTYKRPDKYDLDLIMKSKELFEEKANDFPIFKIGKGDKTNELLRDNYHYLHHLFTSRNLIAIEALWKNLNHDRGKMLVTSTLVKTSSILHNVGFKKGKVNLAGALPNALYVPGIYAERNIFELKRKKLKDLNFKSGKSRAIVQVASASYSNLGNESIDYIFTDPPFGGNLMYSELNSIHEGWLKVITNDSEESIINRTQKKGKTEYLNLMTSAFSEYFRVLKPNKWMTVEFSSTKASIWNIIQTALIKSNFVIASVDSLYKGQGTFNSQTNPTSVKQDLIISCYKPSDKLKEYFENNESNVLGVWEFINEHLNHLPVHANNEFATTAIVERSSKILFDRLVAFYVQRNLIVPMDSSEFQAGLREMFIERDGMFFTNQQVQEYDRMKSKFPEFIQLSLLVSSEQDGVLWIRNLLQEKKLAYQDIQPLWIKALSEPRKGDVLPELISILEENFLNSNGKWYLPNPENEADLLKLRNKKLLKQFAVYKDIAIKPKGKIKECRVDALRVGFKKCYQDKDFKTIVMVGDRIPNNLLMEDEVLLQFYDIASSRV